MDGEHTVARKYRHTFRKNGFLFLIAAIIMIVSVINRQSFLKTLPTLISLVVQLLLISADRKAFLLGGGNAFLYALSYALDGVYFSALYACLISGPLQIFSFFHWKKHSDGNRVQLRLLGWHRLVAVIVSTGGGWAIAYFGLSQFFGTAVFPLLDTLVFTLGIVITLLSAFRYLESQYFSIVSALFSLSLWILITAGQPASLNYVIISGYNLYRAIQAAVQWRHQYLLPNH